MANPFKTGKLDTKENSWVHRSDSTLNRQVVGSIPTASTIPQGFFQVDAYASTASFSNRDPCLCWFSPRAMRRCSRREALSTVAFSSGALLTDGSLKNRLGLGCSR